MKNLKVLMLSPEVVPFAKTGGLADVAGSLPPALKSEGADVRVALPLYRTTSLGGFDRRPLIESLDVPLGKSILQAGVSETRMANDVPVYLIEREDLFDRPNLYGDFRGDYYDNLERFVFYSHAALRLLDAVSFSPDVIHCHDWQTGLVPALIKGPYQKDRALTAVKIVFTIHNIGYQGVFPAEKLGLTGLPQGEVFHPEGLEYWGQISLLKSGIVYSDAITTVSPTYAKQIQTQQYGMGLEGILIKRRDFLHGILNGVDYGLWDPASDERIPKNYTAKQRAGKSLCKKSLISELNLSSSIQQKPLLGVVSRLDDQKGLDLLVQILEDALKLDVGLVILGSGDQKIQEAIQKVAKKYPGKMGVKIGFDESLAHLIVAGADILLIPSRYEPCGLTQMYALKYGTVPVVRATGGLEDTIRQFDPAKGTGNGFKFGPYEPQALFSAIKQSVDLYGSQKDWKRLTAAGMRADFSWDRSARQYRMLYESVMGRSKSKGLSSPPMGKLS